MGRGKRDQTGQATGGWHPQWVLAEPDERAISGTERLWFAVGGGIVFQRVETDDGFDTDLTQTEPTVGGSRLQGAGIHPPALAEPMRSRMFSTEQHEITYSKRVRNRG